jgi:C1A family cysteine protease
MPHTIQKYGWIPDLPDHRDHLYAAPPEYLTTLPRSVDLRRKCPAVYDQGQLGSCTANALAAAIEFEQMKQKQRKQSKKAQTQVFIPSRLFIYYNERVIEGTVGSDSGAQIRDGIKSVVKTGFCPESMWPYVITQFAVRPPQSCYQAAAKHKVAAYQRLPRVLNQMKGCLSSGYPFVFGFTVYASFESPDVAKTGHAPMPDPNEEVVGGHAVMAVGYEDKSGWLIVRNSWGPKWGMKGYFTLPYGYVTDPDLSDDFWTIRGVT